MTQKTHIPYYSNIITKLKHQINIKPEMIIKEEKVGEKKNRSGKLEPVIKHSLNHEYWKKVKKPINVALDEAHAIINSRRSMSKINIIVTDWLALIRRVLGSSEAGYGELTLITQLPGRLDTIARDMATEVRFHRCHYKKRCKHCNFAWNENNDMVEKRQQCPACGCFKLVKYNHVIEVWKFANMGKFKMWEAGFIGEKGRRPYHRHYFIYDIETYFPLYDTEQWDNLFTEYY